MEGDSTFQRDAPSGDPPNAAVVIGRYELYDRIASGGMAAVHLGRLAGPVGFTRTVAIKRLHAQFAADPEFVTMFLDEARLAARIQHPNVVPTIDVVATGGELFLVMEYVRGESVSVLVRRAKHYGQRIPPRIVAAIVSGALQGLHAAHEARDEAHKPLCIVHRDVSPQNILVGIDGTPRVLDFGVAKAEDKFHSTRGNEIKGKLLYMSPEQLEGEHVDRTTDIYAMGLVLYELLTCQRMFAKTEDMASLGKIMRNELSLPSSTDPALAPWDSVVRGASCREPQRRFPTARAMALEVERVVGGVASPVEVADWVERFAGDGIHQRSKRIAEIESGMRIARADVQAALATELARGSGPIPSTPDLESARSERTAGSQVSHILSDTKEAPSSRSRLWMIAAAVGVLAVVGGVAFALGRSSEPKAAAAAASPAPLAEPSATTATPSPPQVTAAPPATYTEPPAASVAAAPTATAPAASAAPAAIAPSGARARGGAHPAGSPKTHKPNCERPYTVDAQGHMHFRTECM
jgi:serine/threonine protein kinase